MFNFGTYRGRLFTLPTTLITLIFVMAAATPAFSELATSQQMQDVCENWLTRSVALHGDWAGSLTPTIAESGAIEKDGVVLAHYYNIEPSGFVVVPVLMEMSPVKVYYPSGRIDVTETDGLVALLRDQLYAQYTAFEATYGSAAQVQPSAGSGMYAPESRQKWNELAVSKKDFRISQTLTVEEAGPLTTTSWHQSSPYNLSCPIGQSGRTVVGCVATAASQILNYWEWPSSGFGSHSYLWPGDNSCSGTATGAQTLSANFSDTYDWASMRDSCDDGTGCTSAQQAALSELCYEVGVAVEMDYGSCSSGASQALGLFSLPYYFKYDWSLSQVCRKDYDLAGWFSIIQTEINAGRPIWYGINSHSIVCDGWRINGSNYEFHMNYGWGQSNNAWYVLDNLYCYWISGNVCPAQEENMVIGIKPEASSYMSYTGSLVDPQGDGDQYAEPGEIVNVYAVVRNLGWNVTNATATLSTGDAYVTITGATSAFGTTISRGQIDTVSAPATLTIAADCPVPHLIALTVHVAEDGGFSGDYPLTIQVGDVRGFSEDCESGTSQWNHRPVVDMFNDQWHLETYRSHTGATSWKAGGDDGVDYADGSDAGLISSPILLAPGSKLKFWHEIQAECGTAYGSAWDGGILMISTDGVSWTKLFPVEGYPHSTGSTGSSLNFVATNGLFSGASALSWSQATFDLSAWTDPVQVMFRFGSDGASTEEGWYVDDIWVGNTETGASISVAVANDLTVRFQTVSAPGSTWADVSASGAALPPGYSSVPSTTPKFYQPKTTASASGSVTYSYSYNSDDLSGSEKNLVLMAYHDGAWQILTTTVDTLLNTASVQTDALYPVVLAEPSTCCTGRVGDVNNSGGDEPTIGDVSVLIDAKFISGSCDVIDCLPEADINQSGKTEPTCGDITIGDISTLIDYLFITGTSLGLNVCK
jgi:hypothetical protein